tara:strand:+ start:3121 stop:3660 length:540 start_codon:yes stop_codon:yes gene_type:complete
MSSATAIIAVTGAAVAAMGAIQQGNAAEASANYNAAVGRNQAITAQNNADAVRLGAAEDAERFSRTSRKRAGTLRAGGASLDLLEDSAMQEELENLSILHSGELQALGFEDRALGLEAGARLDVMRGKNAKTAGYTGAAGALLKGAGAAADSFSGPTAAGGVNLSAAGGYNGSGGLLDL